METIYRLYYDELVYFGFKIIHDRPVVEDIVIDSFLKLNENTYHDVAHARRALYIIVKNKCLSHIRSTDQRGAIIARLFDEEYIDREMIEAGVLKGLFNAINKLSLESKSIIEMYYFDDMSCVEIGSALNKPADTVRSLKRHAIERLFKTIKI